MPPDDRAARAQALLNQGVADAVRHEESIDVSPVPADFDTLRMSFEGEVYRYASEWLKDNSNCAPTSKPIAFVYGRSITTDKAKLDAAGTATVVRYHAFHAQKTADVRGKIVLTTQNLEDALAISSSPDATTQDILNTIEALKLSDRTIAVFEPSHANLILMRAGLQGGSRTQTVLPTGTQKPWKLDELESEIMQFHCDQTRSPSGVLLPWSEAKKGLTGEKLELRISKALAHQLDLRWRRGSILAETECQSGRIDVFVTREVLVEGSGPCVIEVKVLRSHYRRMVGKHHRKVTEKSSLHWAKRGVIQADLYRKDKAAPSAYLCSFDARDKDADLPQVESFAKSKQIEHRRYFMYRSSGDLQGAELAKAEKVS